MEKKNEAAAREVRRDLKEKIRDDWTFHWPPTKHPLPPGESIALDLPPAATSNTASPPEARLLEAIDWRERSYASSDAEPEAEAEENKAGEGEMDKSDLRSAAGTQSRYQFESPDTVGVSMEQHRLARKRKRRKSVEEEMQWNTGLAYFTARRNAWTGARVVSVNGSGLDHGDASASTGGKEHAPDGMGSVDETASPVKATTNGHSAQPTDLEHTAAPARELQETDVLLPVFPPLAPNTNPIRASINPSTYPSLYAKIVMQSLTPSIPINLSDIVRACVRGWQEAGEWPPKGTPAEVAIARRRHAQQIDGLTGLDLDEKQGEKGGDDGADGKDAKEGSLNGSLRRRGGHLRKGVAQVKKVFRLSGGSITGTGGSEFG